MEVCDTFDTKLDADCVECFPNYSDHRGSLVACATYQLDPETKERVGDVTFLRVNNSNLMETSNIKTPAGVFDIKFSALSLDPRGGTRLLGSACADAKVHFFKVDPSADDAITDSSPLLSSEHLGDNHADAFCLSLDFDNRLAGAHDASQIATDCRVVASCSDGSLSLLQIGNERGCELIERWSGHSYRGSGDPAEVWIASFDCYNTQVIYSGADDMLLKTWDLRIGTSRPSTISKQHTAGVCSMQSSVHREHILATGCYDHKVRIWDTRNMTKPVYTSDDLGGGVWRTKWHPHENYSNRLLTACMRGGFQIHNVSVDNSKSEMHTLAKYSEAGEGEDWEALAYGVDWITRVDHESVNSLVGSCTFYDKKFRLLTWRDVESKKNEEEDVERNQ